MTKAERRQYACHHISVCLLLTLFVKVSSPISLLWCLCMHIVLVSTCEYISGRYMLSIFPHLDEVKGREFVWKNPKTT